MIIIYIYIYISLLSIMFLRRGLDAYEGDDEAALTAGRYGQELVYSHARVLPVTVPYRTIAQLPASALHI